VNNNKNRPFLKWPGNKYHCLQHILPSLPKAKRLIEPFTGSAAIFFNTDYSHYLLAEENNDLINLYCQLQQEGNDFIALCQSYFSPSNNSEEHYYQLRQNFNECQTPPERAALFLYLNRHGYNGLCRYNKKGFYNVPFGRYLKPYFPYNEMRLFQQKSRKTHFLHADFRQTFQAAEQGDVIYCDPPYVPLLSQETNFIAYTNTRFSETDQIDLAKLALETAHRGITVLISNHDTDFTREHYRDSEITSFNVRRGISCQAENRLPARELLAVFR
jgi:DNA adenine methylase